MKNCFVLFGVLLLIVVLILSPLKTIVMAALESTSAVSPITYRGHIFTDQSGNTLINAGCVPVNSPLLVSYEFETNREELVVNEFNISPKADIIYRLNWPYTGDISITGACIMIGSECITLELSGPKKLTVASHPHP